MSVTRRLKQAVRRALAPRGDRTFQIADLQLTVNLADSGGRQYKGRASFEERHNPLYPALQATLEPTLAVDIGANYGFTSLVFSRWLTDASQVLVEPSPRLQRYIERNLKQNGVTRYELIQAVCGVADGEPVSFGMNPNSSQDNRVHAQPGWKQVTVPSVRLDSILNRHPDEAWFIKIDTQGFETQVFEGAGEALDRSSRWFIKTEFAPRWLDSQGNSPQELIRSLAGRFMVVEGTGRVRYGRNPLPALFDAPLTPDDADPFVEHVRRLDADGRGWVDLFLAPREAAWLTGHA